MFKTQIYTYKYLFYMYMYIKVVEHSNLASNLTLEISTLKSNQQVSNANTNNLEVSFKDFKNEVMVLHDKFYDLRSDFETNDVINI